MLRTIVLASFAALFAAAVIAPAPSARAQIGTIFSDPPPRPPGAVPRRDEPPPDDEDEVPDLPPGGRVLPAPTRPMPGQQGYAMPGPVQSQPLAPVPGAPTVPQNVAPGIAVTPPAPGQQQAIVPPGQRQQPKGAPQGSATLQPGDEIVTEPPAQKIINKKASFAGLDKITGRVINFDEQIGETVQFGALRVKTDACYTRPATEATNTDAFVEVDEITLQGEVKRIFSGWMFASSPGLHAVEHPIYDIWLTDCKDPETTVVTAAPAEPPKPAAPVAQQKRQPAPRQPRPAPPPPPPPQQQTQQQPQPPPQPQSGGLFGIFR
ncbi:MAG: DUF2155 domain-containing protein [Gemmatimonas sp.]